MKLTELQQVLGERIRIASDVAMSEEERNKENQTSEIIARLAKQMINNADIVLRYDKMMADDKVKESAVAAMIE